MNPAIKTKTTIVYIAYDGMQFKDSISAELHQEALRKNYLDQKEDLKNLSLRQKECKSYIRKRDWSRKPESYRRAQADTLELLIRIKFVERNIKTLKATYMNAVKKEMDEKKQ
jgi:hypothetical protein